MSLEHLLLGLTAKPQSGYDIKQHFDQVFRHFWSAELAQIYPTLKRLEKKGLSRSREVPSPKGPARKVYTRTAAGTRELKAWLGAGPEAGKERLHYLAQVYFLDASPVKDRLAFFKTLRDHFKAEIAELRAIDKGWRADTGIEPIELPDEEFYKNLTLQLGLKKVAAIAEWAEESYEAIKQREGKTT